MGGGFCPFRRDVWWCEAVETSICPLLGRLSLARNNKRWGNQLRFGLFEIGEEDMLLIGEAMGAKL